MMPRVVLKMGIKRQGTIDTSKRVEADELDESKRNTRGNRLRKE